MQCPHCNAQLDDDTIFCGNCGRQVAPLQARGATVAAPGEEPRGNAGGNLPYPPPRPAPGIVDNQRAMPLGDDSETVTFRPTKAPAPPSQRETPQPIQQPGTRAPRGRGRILLFGALLVILLGGGTVFALALLQKNGAASNPGANANGQVLFFDGTNGTGATDALRITITGLSAAASGFHYNAWLVNEAAE